MKRVCFIVWIFSSISIFINAQELINLSNQIGVKFGSPLQHTYDGNYEQLYRDQISVATIMAYWKWTTHVSEGNYTFGETDAAVNLAEQIGADMHGHPLVWGVDQFIPDWVLAKPLWEAEAIMLDHIETVAGRYAGKIKVWDVVNEAIDYDGTYRYCYWNRAMTGEYIIKAFRKAHEVDPSTGLIYNDYEMEINRTKFNTIKDLLGWLQYENVGLTGLGWQMHVYVDDVLDPNFAWGDYMEEISAMGLKNYVTELDIRIPDNSSFQLNRQKEAYKKITQIFLNNSTRGEYFQCWGLSDPYNWWNDFDPSQVHYPSPFDGNMQKKPAYWGMVEAFQEYIGDPQEPEEPEPPIITLQEVRMRNVSNNLYLSQTTNEPGTNVNTQNLNTDWNSQRWNIVEGPDGSIRLQGKWNKQYLQSGNDANGTPTSVYPLNEDWWSMMWFLEPVSGNTYRIKNRWAQRYLTAEQNSNAAIYDFNGNANNQLWVLESVQETRLRNVGKNLYLSQTEEADGANVNVQNLNLNWDSQRWNIFNAPDGSVRLQNWWNDQYLQSGFDFTGASTTVYPLNEDWWSMMWFLEPVSSNTYRIKNRWAGLYITAQGNNDVAINGFEDNNDQLWQIEGLIDNPQDCPEDFLVNYNVSNGERERVQVINTIEANSNVQSGGDLLLRAKDNITLSNNFSVEAGSSFSADMIGCYDQPPDENSLLVNPNANAHANKVFEFLSTYQQNANQCLILGQNIGWSFEAYDQYVNNLHNQTGQWPGVIGGQMRYTSSEINYPAVVNLYAKWQANDGICELSMLPNNPWTGGDAWDRSVTDIWKLTTPGQDGYNAWRQQLDFFAGVLQDMQAAGVTILFRPLMEMNGDWFWFGYNGSNDPQPFINLYRDMFDYYTYTKGLNNLIWVYSANMAYNGIPSVDFYYPGDDVVDITGLDVYQDNVALPFDQYQTMINLGKPFAISEMGPNHNNMNGSHDYLSYVNTINNNFPQTIYALAWHDWPGHLVAWNSNQNFFGALNLPCVVSRGETGVGE